MTDRKEKTDDKAMTDSKTMTDSKAITDSNPMTTNKTAVNLKSYIDEIIFSASPEKNRWNPSSGRPDFKPAWNYVDGCMIKAFIAMYETTKEKKYLEAADRYVDFYISDDGSILRYDPEWKKLDDINEGKVLFPLYRYTGKEKYKKALDLQYSQLSIQPRTTTGNFWHKVTYENQIWLDGLYMALPFYMEYEKTFEKNRNYRDVFLQFVHAYQLMRDENTGLLYHGYDEKRTCFWCNKETGCSKNFWSRSLGWYVMALVDTIELIDERFFYEYETLQKELKAVLDALLLYADSKTKLFYQVTTRGDEAGNYLETSGSAAIAYTLMKGARLKFLPEYYYEYGKEIFDSLAAEKLKEEDGRLVLKDICLVSGLGGMPGKGTYKERDGSFEYYVSEPVVSDDGKGVAPFIFAYCETLRH